MMKTDELIEWLRTRTADTVWIDAGWLTIACADGSQVKVGGDGTRECVRCEGTGDATTDGPFGPFDRECPACDGTGRRSDEVL